MKKTATLLALAGLSMAANPEHLHGSFRNRRVPQDRQLVDPYVKPSKPSETLAADDDELLLIYKPQYDIDPGMVIKPPRGFDIDPGMIIRPPKGDIDRGIFVRPRTTPQVMYADDDELFVGNNEFDEFRPRRGDVLFKPRNNFAFADDELFVESKEVNKGIDAGMIIKPKRGDIDPKMIIKPKRGDFDPKIILNPKKDIIYADDELFNWQHTVDQFYNGPKPIKPTRFDDDELIGYIPGMKIDRKSEWYRHAFDDDELFVESKEVNKGIDAGMVIKPKRGDIDPKMIIKPKRGDFDPKIILNPKKDIIYADDELFNWQHTVDQFYNGPKPIKPIQPIKPTRFDDDELIAYLPPGMKLPKGAENSKRAFDDDELAILADLLEDN